MHHAQMEVTAPRRRGPRAASRRAVAAGLVGTLLVMAVALVPVANADPRAPERVRVTPSNAELLPTARRPLSTLAPGAASTCCALRAANNLVVSAELGYQHGSNGMLRARAASVGGWEVFTFEWGGSGWAFRSQANGKYVSAEVGYGGWLYGMLRARASVIGSWELFDVYWLPDVERWVYQSKANGRYVSAELGYGGDYRGMLRARATQIGGWELFTEWVV